MSWQVIRRIGTGDVQHVRNDVLGIGCFDGDRLETQLEASLATAIKLGMKLRAHVRFAPEDHVRFDKICRSFHVNHLMRIHVMNTYDATRTAVRCCDLIITGDGSTDELTALLQKTWHDHGGRFLGGNFAYKNLDELEALHPAYTGGVDEAWQLVQFKASVV